MPLIGWLGLAWVGCSVAPPTLDDPRPEDRLRALFLMDRDAVLAHADRLLELARSEPDPRVNAEVLRHLAYGGDPRFVSLVRELRGTPRQYAALGALAFHPDGCPPIAEWWAEAERRDGVLVDLELYDTFVDVWNLAPHCRTD